MSLQKFQPRDVYITPGATLALQDSDQPLNAFLNRHLAWDWGEMSEEDREKVPQSRRGNDATPTITLSPNQANTKTKS